MKAIVPLLPVMVLSACASFPELEGTVPTHMEAAEFPKLVPVEPLLAGSQEVQITPETESSLVARANALRARAARLRGPIVDRGTRARMRAGVTGIIEE
ncbi:hypothetical protein RXV86_21550 [Alisedimentitalea sp. MJ-SS2]|uniref:hypothetical protein n=1 Tax=Aliisedimentitalea sp. MJ-SS2 TaxID=3049795 RepID=UPI0029079781|nr:hypothetical protein [Alisedimentitalea sp. MJ-SS2]MDU8929979.1 hypothetical protein [Alisedimentitalea sp. MJ-SS2]